MYDTLMAHIKIVARLEEIVAAKKRYGGPLGCIADIELKRLIPDEALREKTAPFLNVRMAGRMGAKLFNQHINDLLEAHPSFVKQYILDHRGEL